MKIIMKLMWIFILLFTDLSMFFLIPGISISSAIVAVMFMNKSWRIDVLLALLLNSLLLFGLYRISPLGLLLVYAVVLFTFGFVNNFSHKLLAHFLTSSVFGITFALLFTYNSYNQQSILSIFISQMLAMIVFGLYGSLISTNTKQS